MTKIIIRRSRDNMGKSINRLQVTLKRTPEDDTAMREKLTRKIELLKIIRAEMKTLINQL
jgi:hypothetical protein